MTSVDLITGFLGAGKATFIKRYAGFLQAGGDLRRRLEQIMSGCCGKILRVKGCASGKDVFTGSMVRRAELPLKKPETADRK